MYTDLLCIPPAYQKIINLMHNNGEVITFLDAKNSGLYSNNLSFKTAMKELHDRKVVLVKVIKIGRRFCNQYKLTDFGHRLGNDFNEYSK